ncbi:hypothetical protein [Caulobacter segnis]|uniref:Uncharacterized protein n=1 Tax=Caulobacter segnis TaxID=88688 RepID=A0A2W5VF31_9CAUL|nr:hypothetical protein [Caulobacter segnis]PZR36463.1 MAG: hypothetical protein DI526_03225 [Caulobacter segnis]
MARLNPIDQAKAERATCAKSARYWADAADEASAKGLEWIATCYRAKSDEFQARANDLSVALRALCVGAKAPVMARAA